MLTRVQLIEEYIEAECARLRIEPTSLYGRKAANTPAKILVARKNIAKAMMANGYSLQDVADLFGVSKNAIYAAVTEGFKKNRSEPEKLTVGELIDLFGVDLPREVIRLIFDKAPAAMTVDQLRSKLISIKKSLLPREQEAHDPDSPKTISPAGRPKRATPQLPSLGPSQHTTQTG